MFKQFLQSLKTPDNQSLIEAIQKGYQACFEDIHDYYNIQSEKMYEIVGDIIHAKEGEIQPWHPVSIKRITKIWNDFMSMGIIRDEKGIIKIADEIISKISMLHVNTELGGHTPHDPRENYESYLDRELTDDEYDKLNEKSADYLMDENGQYRLSDYGLEPLVKLAIKMTDTRDPKELLLLIDQVLNVVHQRSDLASMFIEGGRMALDELAGYGKEVLTESIDYRHSNESEALLNKFGVTEEDLNYLGSGDFGSAYSMGNGKVLKITSSKSEYELANKIMNEKNLTNIATIYAVTKTPSEYLIVMEELEEDQDIEHYFSIVQEALETQGLPFIYIGTFDEDEYQEQYGEMEPELKKYMDEFSEVVWDYRQITGDAGDIRPENMGRSKDGTIKAFDIDDRGMH